MEESGTPTDRLVQFLTQPHRHARHEGSAISWFLVRLGRTIVLAVLGFNRRQGSSHASALTFYTLLSLVPLAAMAFGVAKGFGFEQLLEKELLKHFTAQQEVIQQVIEFARNMLENTKGGLIAGIGVIVLFWSVVKVLGQIEDNFNQIWSVSSRSIVRKFTDYLSMMVIAPVLLIMSSSVTVFIVSKVSALTSQVGLEEVATPAISLGLSLAPYILLWVLFCVVYLIMPNTRVQLGSAFLAAILAGSAYQFLQIGYVKFQIYVTSYNAIYGSFAALPLFLIWLQLSWSIVLFGAEIAHAFPQSNVVDPKSGLHSRSTAQTRLLALGICHAVVQRFHQDKPALTEEDIAHRLAISPRETREMVDLLIRAHLLSRVQDENQNTFRLLPARDSAHISLRNVVAAIDTIDENPRFTEQHPSLANLSACLDAFESRKDLGMADTLLRDIEPTKCAESAPNESS
ncbi:MAG: YihY/virulence factor BrkB family protein [Deltaproteobacteria bacterium HGW-Deltaproteobacteria-18]|nr:MAG: YihY/virulence factor BrkB family protein [Deltaproteobacteria bacterium HGW-Deltaproteobacteria-18]